MCFLVIIKSSGLWKNPSLTSLKCQVTVKPLYLVFLELFLELLEIVKCRTISWFQDIFNMWSHYVAPVANSIWFIIFIYLFNYLFSSFSCDQVLADVHHLLKGSLVWKVVQDDPSVHCRSQRVNILKISKASAAFKWQKLDLWRRLLFYWLYCENGVFDSSLDQIWLFFLLHMFSFVFSTIFNVSVKLNCELSTWSTERPPALC